MERNDFFGLLASGVIGALTNILHALYQKTLTGRRELLIRLGVSLLAIFPAYLLVEYFKIERNLAFIVGYIAGTLGDRVISEIYRRERDIFNYFVGKPENNDNNGGEA
ncbi:MAG: hypothetical protein WCI81_04055 [Chlorobiaceae bacterium]